MKKLLALLLALVMVMSFAACAASETEETEPAKDTVATEPTEETTEDTVAVMTYAEFMAAETDAKVVIESNVQATQSWWDNKITIYLQDAEGAYFAYEVACTEEDAAKLVPGTKVRISGDKAVWSGEVEIMNATMEILEGDTFVAEATDVTALLGTDALEAEMNKFVAFKGMKVEAVNESGAAFQYNWDGTGTEGSDSDLYFNASIDGKTYTFVIEYYLTGADSDVYKAVQNLKVGDTIDMEGFMYWYEGPQAHITAVTVAG